jgi:serpin B
MGMKSADIMPFVFRRIHQLPKLGKALLSSTILLISAQPSYAASTVTPADKLTPASCTEFGFNFYRALTKEPDYEAAKEANLVISPLSLASVLEVLRTGAKGDVAKELSGALQKTENFSTGPDILNPEVLKDAKGSLSMGNSLWVAERVKLKPEFLSDSKTRFGHVLFNVDFAKAAAASERINSWVADKTAGRIKDLFAPSNFNANTLMAIANAVYFKANWKTEFPKKSTQEAPFTLASGTKVSVPMMNLSANFPYGEVDGIQVLELPYKGDTLSMVLLLPKSDSTSPSLTRLESLLTYDWLSGAISKLHSKKVQVQLPRFTFKFEPADSVEVLKELGVKSMFSATNDLSLIYDAEPLRVSVFKHKAWLEVNEQGTEAAAATGAVVTRDSAAVDLLTFKADRPFLFIIRHQATGTPLFIGRVSNPLAK